MISLLKVSLIGGIMILVITGVRALLQNCLHRTVFLVLWLLTALRLAVPVVVPSTASIYNFLWQDSGYVIVEISPTILASDSLTSPENMVPVDIEGAPSESAPVTVYPADGDSICVEQSPPLHGDIIVQVVWLSGCGICFLYVTRIHIRARRRYRFALPEEGPAFLGKIRLKRSDEISAPLVYGFFRPVILLPVDFPEKDTPEYEHVLHHELTHVHSGDLWFKLGMLLVTCVHWFNPLVWLMLHLSTQDLEIRCDARVIRKLGKKKAYAMTLVQAEVKRSHHFAEAAFAFSLTELRLKAIAKAKVYLPRSIVLCTVLAVLLVCCFSTGPSAEASKKENPEPTATEATVPTEILPPVEAEELTEANSEEMTEETEPKPLPTLHMDEASEMEYLLSCGFEEYGSSPEVSMKEGESRMLSLCLPQYTQFSVDQHGREIATVSWEYSYDEELYYLSVDTYNEGELTIYAFLAGKQWMKIEITVLYDLYYSIPDAYKFEPYLSEHKVVTIEGGTKVVALKLPERVTYSCSWSHGDILSRNDLIITTRYDRAEGLYYIEFRTHGYGYVNIDFYVDGIYWCDLTFDVERDWAQYGGRGKYSGITGFGG